jgi:predicted dehydrogenase
MSRNIIHFGLVGAGRIAQAYAQALESIPSTQLVAVADIRTEAAQALAEGMHCRSFDSFQAMAEAVPLDAVLICTPPVMHPEISIYFLERKVAVMCEKPLCIDIPSAKRMLAAAEKAGVLLTMASKFRYVEDVIRAKSIVESGLLGEIVQYENVFASRVDMSSRWNTDPASSGGGVLIDNGTHSVDIMRYLVGPIAEVNVVEAKRSQGLPVEETVTLLARTVSGVVGFIDLSWSISKEIDSYISIHGTHGTISVGWKESRYRHNSSRDWQVFGKGYDKVQAFRSQIENFANAIRGEEELLLKPDSALASVEVIEAAYQALRQRNWVPIAQATREFATSMAH